MRLRELQQAFVDGVLNDDPAQIGAMIRGNGIAPERRLAIYRNNTTEGFLKTLEATFPVLVRLAGADWFRQTGRDYMRQHPSRSGNIHYIGAHFAAFLDALLAGSDYGYFADVARLEWAYQEVLVAADHAGLDLATLAQVPPDDYATLTFRPYPAMRLVTSRFPLLAIWKSNQPGVDAAATIRLDAGGSNVLVIRRDDHVELRELSDAQFALLSGFARGEDFETASGHVLQLGDDVDLGAALLRLVQLGTLAEFSLTSGAAAVTQPTAHR
jgi:hypothetical protein